jgi:hypothetical protein
MLTFKQYLIEYDVKPKTIFPGYSYDEQEPETRSDEDVEKLKEWIKWHGASGEPLTFPNGETLIPASEVDLLGRPTGYTHHTIVDSPKKKAKAAREARELKKRIKDQEEKEKEEEERKKIKNPRGVPMDELA